MTTKGNPNPRNNPTNTVQYVPANPDSDPSFSDYSLSESYDSSDEEYYKGRQRAKKDKNTLWRKTRFYDPIKNCVKLTDKLFKSVYKSKVIKFKLGEDPLHCRVYFLLFMNSLKIVLSQFSDP